MFKEMFGGKMRGRQSKERFDPNSKVGRERIELFNALGGEKGIEEMVKYFYQRVWGDKHRWFSEGFTTVVTLEHAIWAQTMYWVQELSGVPVYMGGEIRLTFHHDRGTRVMTERGAARWAQLLGRSLEEHVGSPVPLFQSERKAEWLKRGNEESTIPAWPGKDEDDDDDDDDDGGDGESKSRKKVVYEKSVELSFFDVDSSDDDDKDEDGGSVSTRHAFNSDHLTTLENWIREKMIRYGEQYGFDGLKALVEPDPAKAYDL